MGYYIATYGGDDDAVVFTLPLRRMFLLNATAAWRAGLTPAGMSYLDRDVAAALRGADG